MIGDKKIIAVIPARSGSKGIRGKNIKLLLGKPLIVYSIEAAQASKYIDRVIVSTDGDKIARVAKTAGADVPFMRPVHLAKDDTPDTPVFEHCIHWLRENEGYSPDMIVHLRPTGPLRSAKEIDEAIELLFNHPNADSVRSVEEPPKPPYKMWRPGKIYMRPFIEIRGRKDMHTAPRQSLPKVYQTTADIGVLWLRTLLKKRSVIGSRVLAYVLRRPTVDIDSIFDFEIAELILARKGRSMSV